jgi:hypothetical protein
MSTGGLGSSLTDVVASLVYDLEAGRPDARQRAEERLTILGTRLAAARRGVATSDSTRAARQAQPHRPLADFAGTYGEPSFGELTFVIDDGRLRYRWGALYGPAEIFDGAKDQLRIEIAGSGTVVSFAFGNGGPARQLEVQGTTMVRVH